MYFGYRHYRRMCGEPGVVSGISPNGDKARHHPSRNTGLNRTLAHAGTGWHARLSAKYLPVFTCAEIAYAKMFTTLAKPLPGTAAGLVRSGPCRFF